MRYTIIEEAVKILHRRDVSLSKDALQKRGQRGTWPRVANSEGVWLYAVPEPEEDHRDIRENPRTPTPDELGFDAPTGAYKALILEAFPNLDPPDEIDGDVSFRFEDSPCKSIDEQVADFQKSDPKTRPSAEFSEGGDGRTGFGIVINDPKVKSLSDLMDYMSIDTKVWEIADFQAKSWTTAMKVKLLVQDENGQPVKQGEKFLIQEQPYLVTNVGITATFRRKLSSLVKAVNDYEPVVIPPPRENTDVSTVLVVPDTQHGFVWADGHRKLIPLHDRKAIDAVYQLSQYLTPDVVVHLGDGPDFAEFSLKYTRGKEHDDTTQPAINELYFDLKRFRGTAAKMFMLTGNHEDRLPRLLRERASCLDSLRPAYNTLGEEPDIPDPLLEIRRVLSLDQLDINLIGPYGNEDMWMWDGRCRFVHDPGVLQSGGGKTANALLPKISVTTVYGHIHRLEYASKMTHDSYDGPKLIQAASPGCLCRVDGMVPGATSKPDWQHGCAIVTFDGTNVHVQTIPVINGSLVYNGRVFEGRDLGVDIARAIGYPQAA